MRQQHIDDQVFELYDEYCHGKIDRREFFRRAGQLTVAGASGRVSRWRSARWWRRP